MADPVQPESLADLFNRECSCMTLDAAALARSLRDETGDTLFYERLLATRPHLFAQAPVFLPKADLSAMEAIVQAIEAAARLPQYAETVLAWAPPIARADKGPHGAFMGYDFHLSRDGPKLIEINTNAGGAFLNVLLSRAQVACCAPVEQALARPALDAFDGAAAAMFESEWRTQRDGPMRRVAIVDDAPEEQYLHPEFVLAQRLLQRCGFETLIADPRTLRFESGALVSEAGAIDLVYNRLVDFALEVPAHAALREAYVASAAVLTPNPHNHALLADKRNLTILSDRDLLATWGFGGADVLARGIPRAVRVSAGNADALWAERKRYFFKPATGHGGKAVYRGDKITKNAWSSVLAGDYIAQESIPPSERTIVIAGERIQRKLDVRLYTYRGKTLLTAARLYQGQTTNFRTPGGGFAPVFFV